MAKKPKKSRARNKKSSRKFMLKLIGISFVCIILVKHTFILLIAGMLPSIIAAIVDSSPNRNILKTVTAFNFSGVAPYLADMVANNNSAAAVQMIISTPRNWLVMYGAAAIGWGVIKISPIIVKLMMARFSGNKVSKIESEQKKLIDEWGVEVKS